MNSPESNAPPTAHRVTGWLRRLPAFSLTLAGRILFIAVSLVFGGALALVVLGIIVLKRRENLSLWHTAVLEEEFNRHSKDATFADYLAREQRLFAELDERIYQAAPPADPQTIHRFRKGSPADPTHRTPDWNRTFELAQENDEPCCGVLLLHGMSDSPYSLRAIGERLHREGAHVVGLRLPGHGTAPSGLLGVHRKDMLAAVELAMRHLRETVGDRPIHLVGYSNGGALAVRYALDRLEDEDDSLPGVDGIVLISPAIGVSRMAGLAVWQGRIGHWLGIDKLEWNSIAAEYDPYKYNSFAINAGDQVYRLTSEIGKRLDRLAGSGRLESFPPVLAFQSAVDATVSTPALIAGLFSKLPGDRHGLVLFDLNRTGQIEALLAKDPKQELTGLVLSAAQPFDLTVLANRSETSPDLELRHYPTDRSGRYDSDPSLAWPPGIYSLSHVSLPFPPDDPLYGNGSGRDPEADYFHIGNAALRGEKGVFRVPAADQLRLRWNPFYGWLEDRIAGFVGKVNGGR